MQVSSSNIQNPSQPGSSEAQFDPFDLSEMGLYLMESKVRQAVSGIRNLIGAKTQDTKTFLANNPYIQIGKLPNGFTYYIHQNADNPVQKAALSLVVKVGGATDSPDERGIAHMIEHVLLHETEKYKKGSIDEFFKSKGIAIGHDHDASTALNYTHYEINAQLSDSELIEKTIEILSEAAGKSTLSEEIIEGEKGIILDELRFRQGVKNRYQANLWPTLLKGTNYATMLDLNFEMQNVKNCTAAKVQELYKKWYHPENMAFICVGNVDVEKISSHVEKYFGSLEASKKPFTPPKQTLQPVLQPDFVCFSDPEVCVSQLEMMFRMPQQCGPLTVEDLRDKTIRSLIYYVLRHRFADKQDEASAFLKVSCSENELLSGWPCQHLVADIKEGRAVEACQQILLELKWLQTHGITQQEFDFAKGRFLMIQDQKLENQAPYSPVSITSSLISNFISQKFLFDPDELNVCKKSLLDSLHYQEVNRECSQLFSFKAPVISILEPKKEGLDTATKEKLAKMFKEVSTTRVSPYIFQAVTHQPLIKTPLPPGSIVETSHHEKIDVKEFTLSNGVKAYFKPCRSQKNEVAILGFSLRGKRELNQSNWLAAQFVGDFAAECGLGDRSLNELKKSLSGHNISLEAEVGEYTTEMISRCNTKSFEQAFQLLHLMFTDPGYRREAFDRAIDSAKEFLRNRAKRAKFVLADTVKAVNTQNHPEYGPLQVEELEKIDYETCRDLHARLHSNPKDFKFLVVGDVEESQVISMLEKYIASLPGPTNSFPPVAYSPVPFPKGIVKQDIIASKEAACTSVFTFPSTIPDQYHDHFLSLCCSEILEQRLMKTLRMEMGKVYTPTCRYNRPSIPGLNGIVPSKLMVLFTCDAANLSQLEERVLKELADFQENGPTDQELEDYKILNRRSFLQGLRSNADWLEVLQNSLIWNRPLDIYLNYETELEGLNRESIREHFKKLTPLNNYTRVTLLPESSCTKN